MFIVGPYSSEMEEHLLDQELKYIWLFQTVNFTYEKVSKIDYVVCCSPSTSVVSSVGMVPLEDLYQLNQYLQVRKESLSAWLYNYCFLVFCLFILYWKSILIVEVICSVDVSFSHMNDVLNWKPVGWVSHKFISAWSSVFLEYVTFLWLVKIKCMSYIDVI
jgi:hypothetical protein